MSSPTSNGPALNGQVLGRAGNAVRAVLDRVLAGPGIDYHQSVALNATSAISGPTEQLVEFLMDGLKIDEPAVRSVLDSLVARDLVATVAGHTTLTPAGRELHNDVQSSLAVITTKLYGDVPPTDLATAGRVLTQLTTRANAFLSTP
jgi:DNA-binding MarR family transcriptional regulator